MGGGDLNSKKSWHPNTLKNQELVWKAEQKEAQEKKMIAELQRERAQERDRAELNEMARRGTAAAAASDDRLSWMYDKPDKSAHQEDYLLGKTVDSNFDRSEKADQDVIPAVSRRVVGSSMLHAAGGGGGGGGGQVDLARKMREDPLLLIKERERAARAALLQNPLQRRKLTELLRKEQEKSKEKKEKKLKKKDVDLDGLLAAKLNSLSGKGISLASLLESGDSSSESSDDEKNKNSKKKKKKHNKKVKTKKKKRSTSASNDSTYDNDKPSKTQFNVIQRDKILRWNEQSFDDDTGKRKRDHSPNTLNASSNSNYRGPKHREMREQFPQVKSRKTQEIIDEGRNHKKERVSSHGRGSPAVVRDSSVRYRRSPQRDRESSRRARSPESNRDSRKDRGQCKRKSPDRDRRLRSCERANQIRGRPPRKDEGSPDRSRRSPQKTAVFTIPKSLSEAEKAARLAEMASAGAAHEKERGERVARQRAATALEEARARAAGGGGARGGEARALPASLESRIHSNRHNIQRSERHMNENFARR